MTIYTVLHHGSYYIDILNEVISKCTTLQTIREYTHKYYHRACIYNTNTHIRTHATKWYPS